MADPLWINTDAGAPAYDANELRQAMALPLQYDGRLVGARQGVRPGGDQLRVTLDGSTITVQPGVACVDPGLTTTQGPYWVAIGVAETHTLQPADATNPRRDIVVLRVYDHDADLSGRREAVTEYLVGTPSPTPAEPAVPAGAIRLATIDVPADGQGQPAVTDRRSYTVAAGGILPVSSAAERDALAAYPGMVVGRLDTANLEMWSGTGWVAQSGMRLLGEHVLPSASTTLVVSNLPQTYRHLRVMVEGAHNGGQTWLDVQLRFNGDASGSYIWCRQYIDAGGTVTSAGSTSDTEIELPIGGNSRCGFTCDVLDYAGVHAHHVAQVAGAGRIGSAATSTRFLTAGGIYTPSAAITEVRVVMSSAQWVAGSSLRVYGIR